MMPAKFKFTVFNVILLAGLSILFAGAAYSGYRLQEISAERIQVKEDYSLVHSITFGLFSVDEWRNKLSKVVNGEIDDYHITPRQKRDIQKAVEGELHDLIAGAVREINKPQKSIGGKLKKLAFNVLADSAELQAQVRPFAKVIVAKVSSHESEERLKDIATIKINELTRQIYDSTDVTNYSINKYAFKKYNVKTGKAFDYQVSQRLNKLNTLLINHIYGMLGCVLAALVLWGFMRKHVELQTALFVFALLFASILLAVGSLVPVIEVDARIKSFDLILLGETVQFDNQVLFYQSKSIVGIVSTLIGQNKPDTIVVGVLIMLFVLALPLLRLVAMGIYVLSTKKIARHPVIKYLTFELEKWDMADVMIVGMIMTYIGLNGILKSQLSSLNIRTESLSIITDNGTSVQPGYFIFAGYVVFAIVLSFILKRVSPHDNFK
ncbi:MAG: 2-methylisocitrate lyase [Sphingobacteriaceae bacterium]|nr:MAG: 2-methylisocitrate lyase [Sphingobacteriaceae bacterium]